MIRQTPTSEVVPHPPLTITEVTDPEELAQARAQREQFERNARWFDTCAEKYYDENRGKHICIAGQEVFAADSVEEAVRQARTAHPEDKGVFFLFVPKKPMTRIYASSR